MIRVSLVAFIFWPILAWGQAGDIWLLPDKQWCKIDSSYLYYNSDCWMKIQIGDTAKAVLDPHFTLSKWDDEASLKVKLAPNATLVTDHQITGDTIGLTVAGGTCRFYMKSETEFEWEIMLQERPPTNAFSFDIETENLDFYYQPPLTDREITEGCNRPDSIVGSYAVYHSSKRDNEYKTGKAFHIFRPKTRDGNKKENWCDLHIDTTLNKLIITVPWEFVDSALYPVIVDPTFGYMEIGATDQNMGNYWRSFYTGDTGSDAAGATLDSITYYLQYQYESSDNIRWALFTDDNNNPGTKVCEQTTGEEITYGTGGDEIWVTTTVGFTSHNLSANTSYHFSCLTDQSSSSYLLTKYDVNASYYENSSAVADYSDYPDIPDNASGFNFQHGRRVSVYGWYHVSEEGGFNPTRRIKQQRLLLEE